MPRIPAWFLLATSLLASTGAGAGCGDDSAAKGDFDATTNGDASDGTSAFDTSTSNDTGNTSTNPTDTTTPADTITTDVEGDVREEIVGPLDSLKADDTYLVPGNIAHKAEVAAFGHTVAWVETPSDGGPYFVVWDLSRTTNAPRAITVPNLVRPRQLALSGDLLVYVDDRYGTPDVFAVALANGDAFTVVTAPGTQDRPVVADLRVAWEDCRACVTGDDDGNGWEIFLRAIDLARPEQSPTEARITDDRALATPVADRSPAFGTRDDEAGSTVLAWVRGRSEARVVDPLDPAGASALTIDLASQLRASDALEWVAVTPGILAWRTRPVIVNPDSMIVNPDSMYPTDVRATDIAGGVIGGTTRLTTHGELRQGYDAALRTAATKLAWLESTPSDDRLVILDGLTPSDTLVESGMHAFAIGTSVVAFIAPRDDNAGLDDVWVLPVE